MRLTIAALVQGMTDQRCKINYTAHHWFPLWTVCSVIPINSKLVITNRPY